MATVWIPSLLRPLTGGQREVTAAGATVGALIDALDAAYPGLGGRLRDGERLQPGIAIVIDGETSVRGLLDPVKPESEVHIVPAISGGALASSAVRFFRQGKLTTIPAKRQNRRLVLATLAEQFAPGQDYSEDEVNRLLLDVFADFCSLRRALVDEGFLTRSATGSAYRRPA